MGCHPMGSRNGALLTNRFPPRREGHRLSSRPFDAASLCCCNPLPLPPRCTPRMQASHDHRIPRPIESGDRTCPCSLAHLPWQAPQSLVEVAHRRIAMDAAAGFASQKYAETGLSVSSFVLRTHAMPCFRVFATYAMFIVDFTTKVILSSPMGGHEPPPFSTPPLLWPRESLRAGPLQHRGVLAP